MFRRTSILIAAVAVLGLAACGSDNDTSTTPSSAEPTPTSDTVPDTTPETTPDTGAPADTAALIGRRWVLTSFITVGPLDEVPASIGPSLEFDEDGTVAIRTGCNTGSGRVAYTDDRFTIANIERTEMACDDDRMAIETRIFSLLEGESSWAVDGDTLTILPTSIDDAGMILTDVETMPPATAPPATDATDTTGATDDTVAADAAALIDRTWTVFGFITVGGLDEPTTETQATLEFTEDTVLVNTGCNSGSASVTFDGDQLTFGPVALTKKACADDVMTLETRLVALLAEPSYWSVTDDTLTVYPANVTDTGMVLHDLAGMSPTSETVVTGETPATYKTTD